VSALSRLRATRHNGVEIASCERCGNFSARSDFSHWTDIAKNCSRRVPQCQVGEGRRIGVRAFECLSFQLYFF
jgi:hypothetical protein